MWKKQYLQSLVTQKKWTRPTRNFEAGDFVLLVEKNIARGQWLTRRIEKKTYQGNDDLVRVVDVRTAQGVYRRAVHTICLLEETKRHIVDKPLVTREYVPADIEGKGVPGAEDENHKHKT